MTKSADDPTTDDLNPVFCSSVHYRDTKAALAWLERAFGFEVTMAIDGPPESPEMGH
ncbi:hypothetical protein BH24ACT5_BH24ACT5_15680 [soil metagenome]